MKTMVCDTKYVFEGVTYTDSNVSYDVMETADVNESNLPDIIADRNRQAKVDAQNKAREKLRTKNGHSTRPVLSEIDKAENKAKAKRIRDIGKLAESKGLSLEDIMGLLN